MISFTQYNVYVFDPIEEHNQSKKYSNPQKYYGFEFKEFSEIIKTPTKPVGMVKLVTACKRCVKDEL